MDKKKHVHAPEETPTNAEGKPAPKPRLNKKKILEAKKSLEKEIRTHKEKHAGGRPSKLTPQLAETIFLLSHKGLTEQDIADALQITKATITNWKKDPQFFSSLKDAKDIFDKEIERSLAQRAMGFTASDGHYFPPDVTACIFWLKNRKPSEWRDRIPELSNIADSVTSVLQLMRKYDEKKAREGGKKQT